MMNIDVPGSRWRVAEMLALKGWLETRWRLASAVAMLFIVISISYHSHTQPTDLLAFMLGILSSSVVMLAGSGVKSQATTHISFPEGLAQSTQFTISLPVSRRLLITVRAGIGLFEAFAVTVIIAGAVWKVFPSISGSIAPADFARLVLITLLWLPVPYCATLLFQTFLVEPLNWFPAAYGLTLLLWLLHKISPAVDVVRAFGAASPLRTHRLPVSQLATAVLLASTLFFVAVWAVRKHEY
jgi:hypothetical protein